MVYVLDVIIAHTYIVLFSLYPSDGNHSTVLLEAAERESLLSSQTLVIKAVYYIY